ncbi:MAG: hypothetical protein Q9170_006059 [Blastenia crenularia]
MSAVRASQAAEQGSLAGSASVAAPPPVPTGPSTDTPLFIKLSRKPKWLEGHLECGDPVPENIRRRDRDNVRLPATAGVDWVEGINDRFIAFNKATGLIRGVVTFPSTGSQPRRAVAASAAPLAPRPSTTSEQIESKTSGDKDTGADVIDRCLLAQTPARPSIEVKQPESKPPECGNVIESPPRPAAITEWPPTIAKQMKRKPSESKDTSNVASQHYRGNTAERPLRKRTNTESKPLTIASSNVRASAAGSPEVAQVTGADISTQRVPKEVPPSQGYNPKAWPFTYFTLHDIGPLDQNPDIVWVLEVGKYQVYHLSTLQHDPSARPKLIKMTDAEGHVRIAQAWLAHLKRRFTGDLLTQGDDEVEQLRNFLPTAMASQSANSGIHQHSEKQSSHDGTRPPHQSSGNPERDDDTGPDTRSNKRKHGSEQVDFGPQNKRARSKEATPTSFTDLLGDDAYTLPGDWT